MDTSTDSDEAELVDALRKRRPRPDASDEDLGLPRSPTTPQKKHRSTMINQSEGSLSLLSIISSDMDEDSTFGSSAGGAGSVGTSNTSNYSKNSSDMSRHSDDADLDLSVGTKLSHSAARHKMAIRPKKKGPTRHRRPHDTSILPSTPEVNEDLSKLSTEIETSVSSALTTSLLITSTQSTSTSSSAITTTTSTTKLKSQSLPPGVNAKILDKHSSSAKLMQSEKMMTSTSSIYVNKNISKSYDFDKDSANSSPASTLERKDEDGFFKRLLNRSTKKKKTPENVKITHDDNATDRLDSGKLIIPISPLATEPEVIVKSTVLNKTARSGPAARQRVIPQDLSSNLPPKSPKKFTPSSPDVKKSFEYQLTTNLTESIEIPKSKKNLSDEIVVSVSPPKSIWPNNITVEQTTELPSSKYKTPKIYGLSPFQQRISNISDDTHHLDKPVHRRKAVEKSKSFRFYNENTNSTQNLSNSNNLPSLPDLSSNYSNSSSSENEQQFFSIQNPPCKFDISDNNLSQIEENIDKIVKSSYVCMKKSTSINSENHSIHSSTLLSSGDENETIKEEKSRRNSTIVESSQKSDVPEFMKIQLNRVDSTRPKSHVVLSKNIKETENKEIVRRFSNENVEISENKPPLPPDVRRNSINKSQENITENVKAQPIRKLSQDSRKSSLTDDSVIDCNRDKTKLGSDEKLSSSKRVSIDETIIRNNNRSDSRKSISDDENIVVMRKKSTSSNKDDTPELMKVFARRSLKIKDTDDFQIFQENHNLINNDNNIKQQQQTSNLDSDKENQSSSEEKLDKLPKVEITIANGINNLEKLVIPTSGGVIPPKKIIENHHNNNLNNNNNSTSGEIFRKNTITPKPFVASNRFSNVSNFRNTTAFVEIRKNLHATTKELEQKTNNNTLNNINNNNSNNNNNENVINTTNNNINNNNNNNLNNNINNQQNNQNNITNIRHTINVASIKSSTENVAVETTNERMEFKNILQRRAEWEKRAKEGL